MSKSTARACANIALVKYWGKRNAELNLPAAGSLSLTLGSLVTTTTVELGVGDSDSLTLDGVRVTGPALSRMSEWMNLVRIRAGTNASAQVESSNGFPTASGLASSASAYAALALAATHAAGLELTPTELSILARRGSGSAARSIFGGFAVMRSGTNPDGSDSFAVPIAGLDDWPVVMVIAVVDGGKVKVLSSRAAMEHCAETSPLFRGWIESVPGDLAAAQSALSRRDIWTLGEVAERSALTMHASALASRPTVAYFSPATIACMDAVHELRTHDVPAFYTMDAGPHVKVLTLEAHADAVRERIESVEGVTQVIVSAPGPGAEIVS